jgi:hypothetical protein
MIFKNIYGKINLVPLTAYEELISNYVDIVKEVTGVKSIIQIGSFTVPGLSDIDIIVIVDDKNPPDWEDISIRKLLKGQKGYEVIAHDVFVYPEYLSKHIEGLFYIDRKIILYGDDIGGQLSVEMVEDLKLILSFEYTVHRLETLVMLTALTNTNIRDILLFVSTLRHTYMLLANFKIISRQDCEKRIKEIEDLRKLSIDNESYDFKNKLNEWALLSFEAIYNSALLLGDKLKYSPNTSLKKWILNKNKLIYVKDNINDAISLFVKNEKFNTNFKGRVLVLPMPGYVCNHIKKYKEIEYINNIDISNMDPIYLRYRLATEHKKFIKLNKYKNFSSYIIIENRKSSLQDRIKEIFLKIISYSQIIK